MEVEDGTSSQDGDGFVLPNKFKRKKTDDPVINSGEAEQNLLNKNKFNKLVNDKKGNKTTPVVTQPAKSSGKGKLPPLVVRNVDFATLAEKMRDLTAKPLKKLTRFGIKLQCFSPEEFNAVEGHLQKLGVEYYTHDKPSDRPYRVVLRGLPLVDTANLKQRLKEDHDLAPQAVHIIKRKGECATLEESFYLLHFPKGYTNLQKLREIKAVGNIVVRWEAYRNKRADVTQCMSCLHFGHGTRNCHLKRRCNTCGGPHETDSCPDKQAPAKRCANCSGAHSATDRSCPKRAEYIRIRQKATTTNQPGRKPAKPTPAVPALSPLNFPPLPGTNPAVSGRQMTDSPVLPDQTKPGNSTNKGGLDPRARAGSYAKPPTPEAGQEPREELYSMAEVWAIHQEYRMRLSQCKNHRDQVDVVGYMLCKYGV